MLLATPPSQSGGAVAPQAPESGYGAPSFLERLQRKLHGKYLVAAAALVALALLVLAGAFWALRRRSRRSRATG